MKLTLPDSGANSNLIDFQSDKSSRLPPPDSLLEAMGFPEKAALKFSSFARTWM